MFKINDIKELIRAVDRSSIGELTIKGENEQQISISKQMNVDK
jgi:acetyl-CoA carboxylase biotin carboxyl carrier protein